MIRRRRPFRLIGLILLWLVGITATVVVGALLIVDPNIFKPRIAAEVKRLTGRDFAIDGNLRLAGVFPPTIEASNVTLGNMPSGSRREMARIGRVEAEVDLGGLLHGRAEVARLVLVNPDIVLETDPAGRHNWVFTPEAPPTETKPAAAPGETPSAPSSAKARNRFEIQSLHVRSGRVEVIDRRTQTSRLVELTRFDATADSMTLPVNLVGDGAVDGLPLSLSGTVGPLARLYGDMPATAAATGAPGTAAPGTAAPGTAAPGTAAPGTGAPITGPSAQGTPAPATATPSAGSGSTALMPWAFSLDLTGAAGVKFGLRGSLTDPRTLSGYDFTLTAAATDLTILQRVARMSLPPIHDFGFSVRVTDAGGGRPSLTKLAMRLGASEITSGVSGIVLDQGELTAATTDEPIHAALRGRVGAAPIEAAATFGSPDAFVAAVTAGRTGQSASLPPFPIDVTISNPDAKLQVKGGLAALARLAGLDATVSFRTAALRSLTPILGDNLPGLTDVALDMRLRDGAKGLASGVIVSGLAFTSAQADVAGDGEVSYTGTPGLTATLASKKVDVDALSAAFAQRPTRVVVPPLDDPAPVAPDVAATPRSAPNATFTPSAPRRVIPDTPLPLGGLRDAQGDVGFTVGELSSGGLVSRDISGHVVLRDGKLAVDPLTGQMPFGRLDGKLRVDATAGTPPIALTLRAPGVALAPLFAALRLPSDLQGNLEFDADLRGAGRTLRALAASLDGRVSFAIVDGQIDNAALTLLVADLVRAARLPIDLGTGTTSVRCVAARADLAHGVATLTTLALDTSRLQVTGTGTVSLVDEALGLQIRPMLRVGGPGLVLPAKISGVMGAPKVTLDSGATAESALGAVANLAGARLGGPRAPVDICGGALQTVREGRPGPVPPPVKAEAVSAPVPAPAVPSLPQVVKPSARPSGPAAVLRGLVR